MRACRRPSTHMLAKGRRRAALGSAALRPFGLAARAATWHIPHAFVGATFSVLCGARRPHASVIEARRKQSF